jgi:hypothetical protein
MLVLAQVCCGDNSGVGKTFPVSGKIRVDGQPLTAATTIVIFKPDTGKGNHSPFEPLGTVDGQGNYSLRTSAKTGAPPGWYKVVVTATEGRQEAGAGPKGRHPGPRSLLDAKYGQAQTTPLTVEVVENPSPGAYDLSLNGTASPGK